MPKTIESAIYKGHFTSTGTVCDDREERYVVMLAEAGSSVMAQATQGREP